MAFAMLGALAACGSSTAPSTGSILVIINPPPGAAVKVHVARACIANGCPVYDVWITSTQLLTGLPQGSYGIAADPISTASGYYLPSPDQQYAFVDPPSGDTATVNWVSASR